MSDDQQGAPSATPAGSAGAASVPAGLVSAVVNLVHTGPVHLGAYTIAELTAVDAIVDFLEARPPDEVLAEAVRSLAARQMLLAGATSDQVQVRGDLGIAVALQQRARTVLDARVTGTEPGEPWRILVLPQPERICLMVRIDALGVHEIVLYTLDEALNLLTDWLPRGPSTSRAATPRRSSVRRSVPPWSPSPGTRRGDRPRSRATAPIWSSPATTGTCTCCPGTRSAGRAWCRTHSGTGTASATGSPVCWPSRGRGSAGRGRGSARSAGRAGRAGRRRGAVRMPSVRTSAVPGR